MNLVFTEFNVFHKQKLITSSYFAATFMVLPEAEEFDIEIDMNEVRIDYFCSSGPGGQSVNTTYSAVRLNMNLPELLHNVKIKNLSTKIKIRLLRFYDLGFMN